MQRANALFNPLFSLTSGVTWNKTVHPACVSVLFEPAADDACERGRDKASGHVAHGGRLGQPAIDTQDVAGSVHDHVRPLCPWRPAGQPGARIATGVGVHVHEV